MGYETVLDALEDEGRILPRYGSPDEVAFRCPAHSDRVASGSLKEGEDGRALVFCHAGCEAEAIVEALGLEMRDLFVGEREIDAYYTYTSREGTPLFRVVRFRPKGFTQERYQQGAFLPGLNGVSRVLYRLPDVLQSPREKPVYIVEGEKDVERLRELGEVATCNVGGSNGWRSEYAEGLRGRDVVIIPDNDEPGEQLRKAIQDSLDGVARSVTVKYAARGKDVSDHLDAGLSLSQLIDEPSPEEALEPLDWNTYEAPDVQWLMEPYFPASGRVLVFGKAGSLKSLWVMWCAARLAKAGKRVAYFSLEMRPEQTVARLKKLAPPQQNFKVFLNLKMGDQDYLRRMIDALRGYDMIVVDSWNAAYRFTKGGTHDDQVAQLDSEFFQPLISGTGATLVLIDNTGHDIVVGFGNKVESQHARGSSAKGDKMDVTILLTRPDEGNNYLTEIHVKKMRYDIPIPSKQIVCAPSDHDGIEFFYAEKGTGKPLSSMWKEEDVNLDGQEEEAEGQLDRLDEVDYKQSEAIHPQLHRNRSEHDDSELDEQHDVPVADPTAGLPTEERLAYIRAQRILSELEYAEVSEGDGEDEGTEGR